MMNCREAAKILGSQVQPTQEARAAHQHLADCPNCRRRYSLESLAVTLIRAHAAARADEPLSPSPYFFTRLRARIHAAPLASGPESGPEAGNAFWEATMTTARRWLLAFGSVTAILLAAFMLTWHAPANATEFSNEALALPTSSENIVIANSEPLSHDAVLELFADEDYDHARK